ncbi:hypothetical protein GGTG_12716 [Gaeumannomyces tritici R3-111a-1]|uniref:Uncharacterized protein n=1 Tax=Gaeumannomyces tritici (strain R3-111a-1) TaxID=644352 RepID=J3PGT6_GAET3|nr:hypothetical protein GGTG_12716 [Gaeumannomyces tritici R3-111a-1]EJT69833.1 hypothetical protein GGTG_12716 [Gaeumannomyces tritici R3-111a-1]
MNLVWTDSESESENPLAPSSPTQGNSLLWTDDETFNAEMLSIWDDNPASDVDMQDYNNPASYIDGQENNKTTTIQDVGGKNTSTTPPLARTASPFGPVRPNGYMAPFLHRSAACTSLQSLGNSSSSLLDSAPPKTHNPATWPVPALQYMPASALRPSTLSPIRSPHRENWGMAPPVLPRSAFPSKSPEGSPSWRSGGIPRNAPKPATWHQPTLRGGGFPSKAAKSLPAPPPPPRPRHATLAPAPQFPAPRRPWLLLPAPPAPTGRGCRPGRCLRRICPGRPCRGRRRRWPLAPRPRLPSRRRREPQLPARPAPPPPPPAAPMSRTSRGGTSAQERPSRAMPKTD